MVIYRTYRPKSFDELLGQDVIKKIFTYQLTHDSTAHAYIFSGPRGTGKTSTARLVAKSLNCQARKPDDANPCGGCASCIAIEKGASLDVVEVDAASHRGVDNVRDNIIVTAKFQPANSRFKVFIIDEAHMLTTEAWNALLKILEEPPAHAVFILATTELHKVPATILSRCQRIVFRRITRGDIVTSLSRVAESEGLDIAPEVLDAVARYADGGLRDAQSVLEQLLVFKGERVTMDHVRALLPRGGYHYAMALLSSFSLGDESGILRLCDEYQDANIDARILVNDMISLGQAALAYSINRDEASMSQYDAQTIADIQALTAALSRHVLVALLGRLIEAYDTLKKTAFPFLPILLSLIDVGEVANPHASVAQPASIQEKPQAPPPPVPPEVVSAPPPVSGVDDSAGAVQPPRVMLHEASLAESESIRQNVHIDIAQVRGDWDTIINAVKEGNHSLPFIMRKSTPHETAPGKVIVAVEFAFHKDTLEKVKNKQLIENVLASQYQGRIVLEVIVVERKETPASLTEEKPAIVNDILSEFGGMVIG